MRFISSFLCLAASLAAIALTHAQPLALDLIEAADLAQREPLAVDLPPVSQLGDGPVFLSFSARIETRFATGSAPALQVRVNGLPTSGERLRNKPDFYYFHPDQPVEWYSPAHAAWVLPYYAWDRKDVAHGFAHDYVLDITNLLRPHDNRLTFESIYAAAPGAIIELRDVVLLTTEDFPRSPALDDEPVIRESHGLRQFRERAIGYHTGAEATLRTQIAYRPHVGEVSPRESYAQPYEVALTRTGHIVVTVGDDRYEAVTHIGTPSTGVVELTGDLIEVDGGRLRYETSELSFDRSVLRHESHIEIRDLVVNHTDDDLPVTLLNAVDTGGVEGLREFRISGQLHNRFWANTSPLTDRRLGATPVVYVERDRSAVGLVVEDDAYRNQGSVLVWDSTVALADDMFYLGPGAHYTFVWKIFPLAEPDYYTLVNAIRHDWQLFQRIPGLFGFVHPQSDERMYEDVRCEGPAEIADWLRSVGIDIASTVIIAPEDAPGNAPGLYGNEPMRYIRAGTDLFLDWREAVGEYGADPACLPYMDVHLCRLVGETLDDLRERLPGCLIEDAWGRPVAYRSGWLYNVLPTLQNASGQHLLEVMRFYMDEEGFDGIYLDEWNHSRATVSFSHEDGISALLDDSGRIARKVGIVPIMARDFQVEMIRELTARDAVIFANQFDNTLAAAQLPVCHFAEPGGSYDSYLLAAAQLSRTPMGLHIKRTEGVWQDAIEYLRRGLLMCYYWKYLHGDHLLKRCYPITVREIRPGVVIGDDRIVTCASGTFSIGGDDPLVAYVYAGPEGQLTRTIVGRATIDGHPAVDLTLAEGEAAVIMAAR